jgi:hypothetical protein
MIFLFARFYLAGIAGVFLAAVARAIASSRGWTLSNRRLETIAILVTVPSLVFGVPLGYMLLIDFITGSDAISGWIEARMDAVSFLTLFDGFFMLLSFLLGLPLGWILGPERSPRSPLPNPFASGDANPFADPEPLPAERETPPGSEPLATAAETAPVSSTTTSVPQGESPAELDRPSDTRSEVN